MSSTDRPEMATVNGRLLGVPVELNLYAPPLSVGSVNWNDSVMFTGPIQIAPAYAAASWAKLAGAWVNRAAKASGKAPILGLIVVCFSFDTSDLCRSHN